MSDEEIAAAAQAVRWGDLQRRAAAADHDIASLKAELAAAREERDYFKASYSRKLHEERALLETADGLITERDAERVANAGLRALVQRAVDFLFDSDDVEGRLRRDMVVALSAAPPNATTTEKQRDLEALRAAGVEESGVCVCGMTGLHVCAAEPVRLLHSSAEVLRFYANLSPGMRSASDGSLAKAWLDAHPTLPAMMGLAPAPPNALRVGGVEADSLRARVDKLLYGGLIASIGLNLRYVREDFEKMADALNALDAPASVPPAAAPQEQQGAAAHGLVSEAFLRKAKERAAIAHRQPKKHDDRPRCSAKTRRGLPCTSPASQGLTGLCTSHAAQRWNIYVKQHPAPVAAPAPIVRGEE